MFDLMPNLEGQPEWVVVVVVALFVIGSIGVKWVGRNAREVDSGEDGQEGDRPALPAAPGGDAQITLAVTKALDLLANEAVESQEARSERDQLRTALLGCATERDRIAADLDRVQSELEKCNSECRRLVLRALEHRGDSDEQ